MIQTSYGTSFAVQFKRLEWNSGIVSDIPGNPLAWPKHREHLRKRF
jgi:hypothetical protein